MSLVRSTIALSLLAVTLALAGAACGSSSPSAPTTSSADVTISMVGNLGSQSFSPNPTAMRVGQTVAWKNADSITHDVAQDAGQFSTPTISAGTTSAPITMGTAGTFTYHCTIHPGMVGTITVQ